MLPAAYGFPASLALILGGALACFAGYRFFRIVLGIYGFILGAMMASSIMGVTSTVGMIVAAVVGGVAGAVILTLAYFVGIALVGAGIAALIGHTAWGLFAAGEPPTLAVIVVAVAGAVGAMLLQRYVIIVGTAFGGAWTIVVGLLNAMATRGLTRGARATEVWILYPTSGGNDRMIMIGWIVLGVVGLSVQLMTTSNGKKGKR
jgi:hypothetical protein